MADTQTVPVPQGATFSPQTNTVPVPSGATFAPSQPVTSSGSNQPIGNQPASVSGVLKTLLPGNGGLTAIGEGLLDPVKGVMQGAASLVHGVDSLANKAGNYIHPGYGDVLVDPNYIAKEGQLSNADSGAGHTGQVIGQGLEGIAEWIAGEGEASAAIKASEKYAKLSKAVKFLEENPRVTRVLGNALMGGAQTIAHGGSAEDAAENAALGGGISGVVEGAGKLISKLKPAATTIADVAVPVRAAADDPGIINKAAEFMANKPALQEFDITQTQPAARNVIQKLATDARNQTLDDLKQAFNDNNPHVSTADPEAVKQETFLDKENAAKTDDNKLNVIKQLFKLTKPTDPTNFLEVAQDVKGTLHDLYHEADSNPEFVKAQDAEKQARAAFNTPEVDKQVDIQKQIFDKVNGKGMYDTVRPLYSRVDALDTIGKKMTALGVVKNTPNEFLPLVTPNGEIDPGMIDGAALRRAVRELAMEKTPVNGTLMSTWQRAGVPDATVSKLQELGSLLERSRVQHGMTLGRMSPIKAGSTGGAAAAVAELAISHALVAGAGPALAGGAATGYAANRLLGYVMTNPKAADYLLRAARVLATPAAATAVQANRVTHVYNPDTQTVAPISGQ